MAETEKKPSSSKGDDVEENEVPDRNFTPKMAVMPISMMVFLIVVTLSIALFIGPYFNALGFTSGMSDYADNPLYAFVFLGFVIAFAVVILLLRKLLKRRKLNLKYFFAFAVFMSTLYVFIPLVDLSVNGAPDIWDERYFDVDDARGVMPLDPNSPGNGIIVVTNSSFHFMVTDDDNEYEYDEKLKIDGLTNTFDPHYNSGLWVVCGNDGNGFRYWTVNAGGEMVHEGRIENNNSEMNLLGVNLFWIDDIHYLFSFWETNDNWSVIAMEHGDDNTKIVSPFSGMNRGPYYPISGWSDGINVFTTNDTIYKYRFSVIDGRMRGLGGSSNEKTTWEWLEVEDSTQILFTHDAFYDQRERKNMTDNIHATISLGSDGTEQNPRLRHQTGVVESPYLASFSTVGEGLDSDIAPFRLIWIIDDEVTYWNGVDEESHYYTQDPISVFQDGQDGDIYLVFDGVVINGQYEETERMQWYVQAVGFLLSAILMAFLLKLPKWWIIDIAGILMGAGVIAMMGISFPLLFTILLMVLLAIYDAIAVYKTKHMIALADAVVESKMPVLLVFPMKLSYRYEDEKNLMDPKRKRESMFMGLGDVIIPGILIVSAASWLPKYGGTGLFGMNAPLTVAIFTMFGMLVGFGILMRWVIKGKAHAGLPPLNGGAILGFIIGHLIVYGSFIFW